MSTLQPSMIVIIYLLTHKYQQKRSNSVPVQITISRLAFQFAKSIANHIIKREIETQTGVSLFALERNCRYNSTEVFVIACTYQKYVLLRNILLMLVRKQNLVLIVTICETNNFKLFDLFRLNSRNKLTKNAQLHIRPIILLK